MSEDITETTGKSEEEQMDVVEESEDIIEDSAGEEVEPTLESVVEAVLFASDEPMSVGRLLKVTEIGETKQIRDCIKSLNKKYRKKEIRQTKMLD